MTLPTTPQEILDFIRAYIILQPERSEVNGNCAYRGFVKNGRQLKCFIGALLTDEECSTIDNNVNVSGLLINNLFPKRLMFGNLYTCLSFYTKLQTIHDLYESNEWENLLKHFAEDNKLEWKDQEVILSIVKEIEEGENIQRQEEQVQRSQQQVEKQTTDGEKHERN